APHPVRWSHNTRTALRRFRCGGRDRQKRDTAYPGECRRSHIFFPCVPPWVGKIQVPYLSEPHQDCQEGSRFFCGGSPAFMPSPLGGVRDTCSCRIGHKHTFRRNPSLGGLAHVVGGGRKASGGDIRCASRATASRRLQADLTPLSYLFDRP